MSNSVAGSCIYKHKSMLIHVLSKSWKHSYKHVCRPNSRLSESNFQDESEQSGHVNYSGLYGKLVCSWRTVVIRTSDAAVKCLSTCAVNMKAWNCKFVLTERSVHEAGEQSVVVRFCLYIWYWEDQRIGLHLPGNIGNWIIIPRTWSGRCSAARHNCLTCL